jgi:hypothetical protein
VPRPSAPVYVDESIYSKALIQALVDGDARVERVGVAVPFGSKDEVWLEKCGQNGWIALTRDQRIRYRQLEKDALKQFGVGAFTFTGGQATARQTATRIVVLLPILTRLALIQTRPFLYSFGLVGPVARVRL